MTMPEHIARIIERLDPVDRDALDRHLKDESVMGQLMCLQEVRAAIGDPWGRLMQDEVVEKVKSLFQQCETLKQEREHYACQAIIEATEWATEHAKALDMDMSQAESLLDAIDGYARNMFSQEAE